ncbi:forkhead box protein N1 [Eucyclogobius newberryi]|uniref:forkhead box protein N1 n=1 Tax=Eucyclogobius newberryi TaxID=166745 RepID=UPI003B5BE334
MRVSFARAKQCKSSKYSLQKFLSTCPERPSQFPKPIYSYSILIFLALKNSKTGSLPVSEIYSFMTEHFPYFKTAPDGWKNSVRHNLSLNKCFEKVENKNGNSFRKGCLWALNPAKVDKMQEELHKWRRKDPGTVRRSMAKPEELDHLLGEKPNKFRSLATCNTMSTRPHVFSTTSRYEQPRPPCSSSQQYPKSLYVSQSTPHPDPSYPLYSPYSQHVVTPRCLSSPGAGKMPPAYSVAPHVGHSRRSMHDLLMDGDAGCDIDTLNPSLTDLQLQGSLWEELKEDSARVVPSLSPSMLDFTEQSCYLQPTVSPTLEMTSLNKAIYADEAPERLWGQDQNYLNGVYSGMESFA